MGEYLENSVNFPIKSYHSSINLEVFSSLIIKEHSQISVYKHIDDHQFYYIDKPTNHCLYEVNNKYQLLNSV